MMLQPTPSLSSRRLSGHDAGRGLMLSALLLCCAVEATKTQSKTPSDYLVKGLEDVEPSFESFDGDMYAGMIPFESYDGHSKSEYMFWMFEPTEVLVPDTVVIWLNGGPGCTSFNAGLVFETAPVTTGPIEPGSCCIDPHAPLQPNPYAWTNSTIMLYVEQPGGTGFSHGPPPHTEQDLSKDFHSFLVEFYQVFDALASHKLYFFGESYAGMYVPSIAHQIYLENLKDDAPLQINLAGIGLGNGLIDVTQQTEPMIDYAYYHGLIDSAQRKNIQLEWERCYTEGHEEDYQDEPEPYHSFNGTKVLKGGGLLWRPWIAYT